MITEPKITNASPLGSVVSKTGWNVVAVVQGDSRTYDIAARSAGKSLVVRHAECGTQRDYSALITMLAEGDFQRAILVYADKENSVLSDAIETWHIDDIETLAARLAAEAAD